MKLPGSAIHSMDSGHTESNGFILNYAMNFPGVNANLSGVKNVIVKVCRTTFPMGE